MFYIIIAFIFIYLVIKYRPKSNPPEIKLECDGRCDAIYNEKTRQWKHSCNNIQIPLMTCVDCLNIYSIIGHEKCKKHHCRNCGQRFRWNMPGNNLQWFDAFDLPLWLWCQETKEWECMDCHKRLNH